MQAQLQALQEVQTFLKSQQFAEALERPQLLDRYESLRRRIADN
jgi:hypothetical protein